MADEPKVIQAVLDTSSSDYFKFGRPTPAAALKPTMHVGPNQQTAAPTTSPAPAPAPAVAQTAAPTTPMPSEK